QHRHGQQLVDLVDAAEQQPRTDPETDAAPQPWRLKLVLRVGSVRQRQPLVTGQDLERSAVGRRVHVPLDSKSLMQASRSFSFTGLVMNARAPWRMPQTRSVSIDLVVIITTGTCWVFGSRVSVRVAWKPFMPGMITSMMTRSGCSARTRSMPSSAVLTAATWCPARSSSVVNTRTSVGESSMMRILATGPPQNLQSVTRCSADMSMDRTEQLVASERLGEVLLGAHDATARLVEQPVLRAEHDHRRGAEFGVVLDQRAGLITVQPGHHDVDEDDRRLLVGDLGERLEPVDRGQHLATLLLQQGLRGAADGLGVIDHHDLETRQVGNAYVQIHSLPPAARHELRTSTRTCNCRAQWYTCGNPVDRTARNPLRGGASEALLFTACPSKLSSDNSPRCPPVTQVDAVWHHCVATGCRRAQSSIRG